MAVAFDSDRGLAISSRASPFVRAYSGCRVMRQCRDTDVTSCRINPSSPVLPASKAPFPICGRIAQSCIAASATPPNTQKNRLGPPSSRTLPPTWMRDIFVYKTHLPYSAIISRTYVSNMAIRTARSSSVSPVSMTLSAAAASWVFCGNVRTAI